MTSSDRDIIDQYLRGELQGEARSAFRARLPGDAVLRREVENMLLLLPGIHDAGKTMLKAKLKLIQATLPAKLGDYTPSQNGKGQLAPRKVKWPRWKWITLTAGIAVVIAASVLVWMHYTHHGMTEGEGETPKQEAPVIDSAKHGAQPQTPAVDSDSCKQADSIAAYKERVSISLEKDTTVLYEPAPKGGKRKPPGGADGTYDRNEDIVPSVNHSNVVNKFVTVVIPNDPLHKFHYRFADTLFLYGPFNTAPITSSPQGPVLRYNGQNYLLKPVKKITSLGAVLISSGTSAKG